jgi:hypothetical protein
VRYRPGQDGVRAHLPMVCAWLSTQKRHGPANPWARGGRDAITHSPRAIDSGSADARFEFV